jgi:hypothetical protein
LAEPCCYYEWTLLGRNMLSAGLCTYTFSRSETW